MFETTQIITTTEIPLYNEALARAQARIDERDLEMNCHMLRSRAKNRQYRRTVDKIFSDASDSTSDGQELDLESIMECEKIVKQKPKCPYRKHKPKASGAVDMRVTRSKQKKIDANSVQNTEPDDNNVQDVDTVQKENNTEPAIDDSAQNNETEEKDNVNAEENSVQNEDQVTKESEPKANENSVQNEDQVTKETEPKANENIVQNEDPDLNNSQPNAKENSVQNQDGGTAKTEEKK